jgi:hypothetical protein
MRPVPSPSFQVSHRCQRRDSRSSCVTKRHTPPFSPASRCDRRRNTCGRSRPGADPAPCAWRGARRFRSGGSPSAWRRPRLIASFAHKSIAIPRPVRTARVRHETAHQPLFPRLRLHCWIETPDALPDVRCLSCGVCGGCSGLFCCDDIHDDRLTRGVYGCGGGASQNGTPAPSPLLPRKLLSCPASAPVRQIG